MDLPPESPAVAPTAFRTEQRLRCGLRARRDLASTSGPPPPPPADPPEKPPVASREGQMTMCGTRRGVDQGGLLGEAAWRVGTRSLCSERRQVRLEEP